LAETPNLPLGRKKAVIRSDSIAAIQFVASSINFKPKSVAFKKALVKTSSQEKTVKVQWNPSHSKILGNDTADTRQTGQQNALPHSSLQKVSHSAPASKNPKAKSKMQPTNNSSSKCSKNHGEKRRSKEDQTKTGLVASPRRNSG
jgi:hypothetical protein